MAAVRVHIITAGGHRDLLPYSSGGVREVPARRPAALPRAQVLPHPRGTTGAVDPVPAANTYLVGVSIRSSTIESNR